MVSGKIIYVYDALCGWCYGFSPVIQRLHQNFSSSIPFEVVSGGMVTGSRIGAIGQVAPYISWAYKDVEQATGVKFGSVFLEKTLKEGKAIFTSVPPAIALSVFKTLQPDKQAVAFAAALQKAIYYDGIEPLHTEHYGILAQSFGIDAGIFTQKMAEPMYLQLAEKDFSLSQQLGVSGFPTVIYENSESKKYALARGYLAYEALEKNLKMALEK